MIDEVGSNERPHEGTVMAVGPDVKRLKVGDVVLFTRFAGQEGVVPLGIEKTYVVLEEQEVIATLDETVMQAAEDAIKQKELDARSALADLRTGKLA